MSFDNRVVQRTNQILKKIGGNVNRLNNREKYKLWNKDLDIVQGPFLTQVVGEMYGELRMLRTSKQSLKKNSSKIRYINDFLKNKKAGTVSLEDICNYIAYLVCTMPKDIESVKKPGKSVNIFISEPEKDMKINTNKMDTSQENKRVEKSILEENTTKSILEMETVDDWEQL